MGAKKIKNAKAAIKASAAPRRKERVKVTGSDLARRQYQNQLMCGRD